MLLPEELVSAPIVFRTFLPNRECRVEWSIRK
jgi:hypothetical protein